MARLTVRLGAIRTNFRTLSEMAGTARIGAAVKADCYGLGMARIAPVLAAEGCRDFFVANAREGAELRALPGLASARIFVLHGPHSDDGERFARHDLTPVLNSESDIAHWRAVGAGRPSALHIDTGMHRLGLSVDAAGAFLSDASAMKALHVVHVMSHLACSDEPDHPMNGDQRVRFAAITTGLGGITRSLANSAGIALGSDYHFDLVRPGIGLYGARPGPRSEHSLRPAVELTAPILALNTVNTGEGVGYGRHFVAPSPRRIATLPLGYADGIPRRASGRAFAYVGDQPVPFVGRVSMDLTTLDVTECADIDIGQPVRFFGRAGEVETMATHLETIAYELLTSLSRRALRSYEDQ
jgi:alanine racemase